MALVAVGIAAIVVASRREPPPPDAASADVGCRRAPARAGRLSRSGGRDLARRPLDRVLRRTFPARAPGRRRPERRAAARRRADPQPHLESGQPDDSRRRLRDARRVGRVRSRRRHAAAVVGRSRSAEGAARRRPAPNDDREGVRPAPADLVARRPVHRRHRQRTRGTGVVDDFRRRRARAGAADRRVASRFRRGRRAARSPASRRSTAGRASRARAAAPSSRPIPTSTSTGRSRSRSTARRSTSSLANTSRHASICGRRRLRGGRARRLTSFSRDTLRADRSRADRSVTFKVQSYRTVVALAPAAGGPSQPLATFQSETPSWDPTGRLHRDHLRHVAARRRRCEVSGHRAGRGHHRGGRRRSRRRSRRASSTRRTPKISRSAGRRTAGGSRSTRTRISPTTSGCARPARRRRRRRAASASSAAAPKSGGRAGRPMAAGCCSRARARRRAQSVAYVVGVDQESGAVTRRAAGDCRSRRRLDASKSSHAEWLPDSAHLADRRQGRPGPARDLHRRARWRRRARRPPVRVGARRAGPRRLAGRTRASRSSRRRPTGSFRCSGCRSRGGDAGRR